MTTFEKWVDVTIFILKEGADRCQECIEEGKIDALITQNWAIIKQINSFWEYVERRRKDK